MVAARLGDAAPASIGLSRPRLLLRLDHRRDVGEQRWRVVNDAVLHRLSDPADALDLAVRAQPLEARCRRAS